MAAKRGLPTGVGLKHDSHYVEDLARSNRSIGRILPIDKIEPNPEQPRVEIGDLTELTSSIKEKGVLEPLLVKPNRASGKWMIIAGERRWRSATLAGLKEVPCIELDLDEQEVAEIALIENLQRKDLTIWEEADGLAALSSKFGYTHDEIARKIGKSRTTVTECMSIAGLPADIRRKCLEYSISAKSTLLEIARQFDEKSMHQFLERIQNKTRDEIRKTARPHLKEKDQTSLDLLPPQSKMNSLSKPQPAEKKKVFKYISEENKLLLEVFSVKPNAENVEDAEIISLLEAALKVLKNK